jgi:hypothetical protein
MANLIECYVCQEHKRSLEVNGWWTVGATSGFSCEHMPPEGPPADKVCVCGASHASVLFQRFLTTGALEKEVHAGNQSKPVGLTEETILSSSTETEKGQNGSES